MSPPVAYWSEQPLCNKFCQQCLQYNEALHHNQNQDTWELTGQYKWGFPSSCRLANLVKCGAVTPVEFRSVGQDILHILRVAAIMLQIWPYYLQTYIMHKDCDMNPQHLPIPLYPHMPPSLHHTHIGLGCDKQTNLDFPPTWILESTPNSSPSPLHNHPHPHHCCLNHDVTKHQSCQYNGG